MAPELKPPFTSNAAQVRLMLHVLRCGLPWFERVGVKWFNSDFKPIVERIERHERRPSLARLVRDIYCMWGDLLFVQEAYWCALDRYERAGSLGTSATYAKRCADETRYIIKTFSIPSMASASKGSARRLDRDDTLSIAREQLASGKPGAAISTLGRRAGTSFNQLRAMCHGALGNASMAFKEWELFLKARPVGAIALSDWFYLDDSLWNDTQFWRDLRSLGFSSLNVGMHSPDPKAVLFGPPELIAANRIDWVALHRVRVSFHVARCDNDAAALMRLGARFPKWRLIRSVLSYMKRHGPLTSRFDMACLESGVTIAGSASKR